MRGSGGCDLSRFNEMNGDNDDINNTSYRRYLKIFLKIVTNTISVVENLIKTKKNYPASMRNKNLK